MKHDAADDNDLEIRLGRLPLAPLPVEWRAEILHRAALAAQAAPASTAPATVQQRLLCGLRRNRGLAWAVGLAWAAIVVLRLTMPADPAPLPPLKLEQSYSQRLEAISRLTAGMMR